MGFTPLWIRPAEGYTGNHILVARGRLAFDYHGYSDLTKLLAHMKRRANRWWPGWSLELVDLPEEVLVSEAKSRTYKGLWLKEPRQFLFDALPRAERFLDRFPPPRSSSQQTSAGVEDGSSSGAVMAKEEAQ
jgi:hypothetical protein